LESGSLFPAPCSSGFLPKVAAVTLANKIPGIAWALLAKGEIYRATIAVTA
jgi:hypothetical protein